MMSGNVEAIVHDNLAKLSEESQFSTLQSQSYMWLFIWRTFGAISWWYLFVINPTFPYIGNLAIFILYTTTIFFFPKDEQVKSSVKNDFEHIVIGLRDLWKNKSTIIMLFLVILASSIGNIYWFTYQEYFRLLGLSLESFGWFYALTSAVSGIAAWILWKCIEKKISQKILLSIIIGLLMISSFLFAFHQELWSLFGLVSLSFMFGWIMTLGNTLILTSVASTHKSFAISAFSFAMTLGYASFTFMAGFFIERYWLGEVYRYIAVSLLGIGILGCIMLFSVAKK